MHLTRGEIRSERLRRLFDYWDRKRGDRAFPARADLDPLEFRYILGNIAIAEVERDPLRFRFRLVGTEIVQRDGTDLTGRYTEDHPQPEYRALMHRAYSEVIEAGQPRCHARERLLDGRMRRYEVLYLPLASDGQTIDMLLVGIDFPPLPAPAQS